MTPTEFRSELKKAAGGYLFCGEEGYLKRHYLTALRGQLGVEGDVFNHVRLTEQTYSPEALAAAVESLPMMAEKKLIEVSGLFLSDMKEADLEELCAILSLLPHYEYTVLVLLCEPDELAIGTPKQPTKAFARLGEVVKPVVFNHETPARLASWVAKHFAAEQIVAPPDTVTLLLDRCGCDMYALSSEIEKLSCYLKAKGRERLETEDVIRVSSESPQIAAFDFANAILDAQADKAFSILNELKRRKEKPEILLGGISHVIADLTVVKTLLDAGMTATAIASRLKMHEFKAKLYVKSAARTDASALRLLAERCYEADLKIKSTGLDSYAVLDRLAAEAVGR